MIRQNVTWVVNYHVSSGALILEFLLWWALCIPCSAVSFGAVVIVMAEFHMAPLGTGDRHAISFEGPHGVIGLWLDERFSMPDFIPASPLSRRLCLQLSIDHNNRNGQLIFCRERFSSSFFLPPWKTPDNSEVDWPCWR